MNTRSLQPPAAGRPIGFGQILGAAAWLFTAETFFSQLIAQSRAPGYDFVNQDISMLGVTACGPLMDPMTLRPIYGCSPLHGFLNGGFVAMGVAVLFGIVMLRRFWTGWTGRIGSVLIGVAAIGAVLSGLAPMNVNLQQHLTGAMLYFPLSAMGILLLGVSVRRKAPLFAALSWLCGAVALVAFFTYGNYHALGMPRGILERIAAYPSTIWFAGAGAYILLRWRRGEMVFP